MMCVLSKGFNMDSEKGSITIEKNATTLKFEEHLENGNGDAYSLAENIYTIPKNPEKLIRTGRIQKGKQPQIWNLQKLIQTLKQ